jgi:hypothetical protein
MQRKNSKLNNGKSHHRLSYLCLCRSLISRSHVCNLDSPLVMPMSTRTLLQNVIRFVRSLICHSEDNKKESISHRAYLLHKVPRGRNLGLVGYFLHAKTDPHRVTLLVNMQRKTAITVSVLVFDWTGVEDHIVSKAHGLILLMSIASLDRGRQMLAKCFQARQAFQRKTCTHWERNCFCSACH